ncbi:MULTISPECIES: hypothetical protein [Aeromonas]|uniref:hypothetical protein n=1 Tax=Aeromonas TaxID=642 RepID=UPI002A7598E0|nr:hypothetical protein [Aeromonas jandaei]
MNPLRLVKWFFYFVFGCIFLAMVTMMAGNYVQAAEWVASQQKVVVAPSSVGSCVIPRESARNLTQQACLDLAANRPDSSKWVPVSPWVCGAVNAQGNTTCTAPASNINYAPGAYSFSWFGAGSLQYVCPPDGNPDFKFGPKVTDKGTVCEKAPVQCLTGSIKDVNAITGKEFCRPMCDGIAGNTLGSAPDDLKSYMKATLGSVQMQCYGQCSVVPVGGSINVSGQPNVWKAVIKFTGEKCPLQHNGQQDSEDVAGTMDPVSSSTATGNAQNQLQNAASSAISNQTSGATGTATLNSVVDKIAETSNKEIKATSEQNAAMGKVIQEVGKDIQTSIKEAQLSQSQGNAGASLGQIQTANAIKDGNAQTGQKLDAIKDALEKKDEGNNKPLPPGITKVQTDAGTVYTNRNDWATRNYNTVLQHHVSALQGLPMFQGIGSFFSIHTSAGSCPQFTIAVPEIGGFGGGQLVFDAFCNPDLAKIFVIIALCIKLAGLYVGFRIAVLD